jgi:hypothetical protein
MSIHAVSPAERAMVLKLTETRSSRRTKFLCHERSAAQAE